MGALNPFALWGILGAIGISVPIIIHLLYRKHRKQTDWAAMELLRRALVIRSGQVKLEDYLILALRCLALLLIAAALLRPTLSSDSASWLGEKRVGMVVAIDASFSMNHGEHSRFEKAVEVARQILSAETAREGDPVSVVLMSSRPQVLLRSAGYQRDQVNEILGSLESATPYRLGLEQNVEQIEELLAEFKTPGKECYLITDSQELDWATMSDTARASLERLKSAASVFVVPVPADGEENLSLASLSYASGSLRKSGVARFTAKVRNAGRRPAAGGTVEFFVDGELSKRRTIGSLEPGETRDIDFFASFDKPGDIRLKAQLSSDELADDNVRFAVASIRSGINVLSVEGSQAADSESGRGGAYYAVKALRLKGRGTDSPIQVSQVEAPDLGLENLTEFDVIVLADVPDVAPEIADRLRRFVARGGGLIIFVGEGVDPAKYNERFGYGEADGLLPAKLLEPLASAEDVGWAVARVKSDHPLANVVDRLPEELLDSARLTKVLHAEPAAGSETILSVAEIDTPLLLERKIGSGSVLMFTSSADRSWNELAVHPVYAMLLQQAVTNLTSHPDALQLTVGEQTDIAVAGREVGDAVVLNDPAGNAVDIKLSGAAGRAVCAVDPSRVGLYEIAAAGDSPAVVVGANVDAAEAAVRVVDAAALSAQLDPLGVRVVPGGNKFARAIENGRRGRELAHVLLWLGILVFIAQSLLAKYFTNKMGREETADLSATLQLSRVAAARRS